MKIAGSFSIKLAAGFVGVLLIFGSAAIFSFRQFARTTRDREAVTRTYVQKLIAAERLRSSVESTVATSRGYLITKDPDFLRRLDAAEAALNETYYQLLQLQSPEEQGRLDLIAETSNAYSRAQRRILEERSQSGALTDIRQHFEREVVPLRRRLDATIDAFVTDEDQRLADARGKSDIAASRAIRTSVVLLSLAALLSILAAWGIGRHLARAYRREKNAVQLAEHALAQREELLAIVAHDLRNPIAAIRMKSELLGELAGTDKVRTQAASIEGVAVRMERLIQSLLDAASIEAGQFSVNREPCDVDALLTETMEVASGLASAKGVHLERHLATPGLRMLADRVRVLQVLANLVGNAIKFTPAGGRVEIAADQDGETVRFAVSDTGAGIAAVDLPRVFDRFWKAETGGKLGTGLGLYIAKGIVDAHGGRIWVAPHPGGGTTFCFAIPCRDGRSLPIAMLEQGGRPAKTPIQPTS